MHGPTTDTAITGITRCGLAGYTTGACRWDDFSAADSALVDQPPVRRGERIIG